MNDTWWIDEADLDDHQRSVVINLPIDGCYIVTGPPGSGKTNLLVLRAKYLSLAGYPNIAIVVFTRSLRDFIASGASRYAFDAERVVTSQRFYMDLLREQGVQFERATEFSAQRANLVEAVTRTVDEHGLKHMYDAILLDEAQDYTPEEIALFQRLTPRLFAVADSRQRIYESTGAVEHLKATCTARTLKYHYRNGPKICEFADAVGKVGPNYEALTAVVNYDDQARPSSVDCQQFDDMGVLITALATRIEIQALAYPNEAIGVLTPKHEDAQLVSDLLQETSVAQLVRLWSDGDAVGGDDHPVIVSTIHSAKGLEFRAAHLVLLEKLKKFSNSRNLTFTGITRAKTALAVYHIALLPGFLNGAVAKTRRPPDLPSMADILGSKKL